MTDLSAYRELFPVTRELVFLNHAAIAAPPIRVVAAMQGILDEQARLGSQGYRLWQEQVAGVRLRGADLLGAGAADIAFVPNTSSGLSLVAEGFPWRPGDAVLVPTPDFPANVYPWQHLARRGVNMIPVPRRAGELTIDDFARVMTDRVRMLVVSSVDYATGYAVDLAELGRFCHAHDLVFGVDAIQSLGVRPLDVVACQIDFLAAGAHKWLLGPMGIGLLYLSPELRQRLEPPVVGWKSVVREEDFRLHFELRADAAGFEPGTLNLAAIVGLGAALELLSEVGIERIGERVTALLDELATGLEQRALHLLTPWQGKERCGILSFVPSRDPQRLFQHLATHGVALALRDGGLRVSPHFYNDIEDLMRFFADLDSYPS